MLRQALAANCKFSWSKKWMPLFIVSNQSFNGEVKSLIFPKGGINVRSFSCMNE